MPGFKPDYFREEESNAEDRDPEGADILYYSSSEVLCPDDTGLPLTGFSPPINETQMTQPNLVGTKQNQFCPRREERVLTCAIIDH